jgi:outer membrane lipoprotein-sorting protein
MKNKRFKMMQSTVVLLLLAAWAGIGFGEKETAQQIVNRASQAYNHQWKGDQIKDWMGTGKIMKTGDPDSPLNFTLIAKQKDKVKFIVMAPDGNTVMISEGSDGKKSWHCSGLFIGEATGSEAHFIDSHTIRWIARLFDDSNSLKDLGPADRKHAPESASSRVIEATNNKGKATRYYIDNTFSLITRIEFETGAFYAMFFETKEYPALASFVFSDYRSVNGIPTPFKIEVYEGLIKIEELNFTSVQYNTGVKDKDFVP